jgi:uncharacterized protein YjbJ (UPF0337 family)
MDDDRIKGAAQDITGKIEDAVGAVTGDLRKQINGKLDQGAGKVRNAFGRAKDSSRNAAEAVQDAAADAGENIYEGGRGIALSLARSIEDRPLAAVLLAAAVGYGIACLVKQQRR